MSESRKIRIWVAHMDPSTDTAGKRALDVEIESCVVNGEVVFTRTVFQDDKSLNVVYLSEDEEGNMNWIHRKKK